MDIADTIDWRRVKSFSMLCTVSEIYKVTKHYSEARDILLLAYERYPDRANVVYALCELAVKLDEVSDAIEYYREYVHLKPHDTNRYVLLYKIYDAQDVPLEEKISLLEEFKRAEYTEKWAYELALLYHKDGQETKCVETCDELALWFGEGPYVRKALELKMQHSPLTKEQQMKYDGVYDAPKIPTGETEETVHIYETQSMPRGVSAFETSPIDDTTESLLKPSIAKDFSDPKPAETPAVTAQQTADIKVAPYSNDKYSTMNLQEELAKNMEEFYAKEKNVMPTPFYGVTSELYDQSQEQFMKQLNNAGPVQEPVYAQPQEYPLQPDQYNGTPQMMQPQNEYEQPSVQPIYGQQMLQNAYEQPAVQPIYGQQMPQNAYEQPSVLPIYGQQMPAYGQQAQIYQQPNAYEQPSVQLIYGQQMPAYGQQPVYGQPQTYQPVQPVQPIPAPAAQPLPVIQPQPLSQPVNDAQQILQAAAPSVPVAPVPSTPSVPVAPVSEAPSVAVAPVPAAPSVSAASPVSVPVPAPAPIASPAATPAAESEKPEDEQIPGQIDLSDFMKDWEEKKKNGEEQRKQTILNRTKEQTQDIMSQLVGVIPGIEQPQAMPEQKPADNTVSPADKTDLSVKEEVIKEDKKGVVTRTTIPSPVFEREPVKRTESGARINGPARTSITESIPDILPNADLPLKGDILPSGRKLTLDEEYGGNIAKIRKEDEELVKRLTGEIPEPEEDNTEPEITEPEPVDYGEAEEIEEVEQPDLPEEEEEERVSEPVVPVMPVMPEPEPEPEEEPEYSEPEDEVEEPEIPEEDESDNEPATEEAADDSGAVRHGLTAPIEYPYDVDDLGEVEELVTIDQPDDVDDMIKTRPIPQEEIEARMRYEAGIEEDDAADDEGSAKKGNHPSWMKLEENVTSRREFDEAEMAIFGRFEGIESLKAQIVDVMDDMRMEASRGNVIVMGSEKYGRKSLAIDIVKAIQAMDSTFSGKVAKISGEALNKKNIPMTLQKLRNGALIVENAGGLTPITVNSITETLRNDVDSILVVFEGEKESLEPLLNGCVETKTVFDARITIEDFSNSDLVAYAKGYARELEYSIDDMGTLALYNKIGDMQTIDHVVSVDEVTDIVDNAIRHVDRKNMSHFMDVLLAKRYDDDDFIVLREKDFLN